MSTPATHDPLENANQGGSHSDPLSDETRPSAEVGLETIRPPPPSLHENSLQALATRGDTAGIMKLLEDDPTLDLSARDPEGITALHWAAINGHMGTSRFLLDHGAEVDAVGGELQATPLQWASRNGLLYMIHLLLSRGADPNLRDISGFTTLHLITQSSAVMPVLYILHQPIAIDEKDKEGYTALMWAAYQGDAISVDLLLRQGASVGATDNMGRTPLHWAAVRGSVPCIRRLLLAGADLEARENDGKTPRDTAEELRGSVPFLKGLHEAGYSSTGAKRYAKLSDRHTNMVIFALPTAVLFCVFKLFDLVPFYSAIFLAPALSALANLLVTRVLLAHKSQDYALVNSPYFLSIIWGSIFWVFYCWATRLVTGTPGHALADLAFFVSFAVCSFSLYKAMSKDPGYIPKPSDDSEIKMTLEDLIDAGGLNGTNFCTKCMIRKPLRSKHCHQCGRCVARYDHHCPWIWNCVGIGNHRYFLIFLLSLIAGIVSFDHLVVAHVLENAPEYVAQPSPGLTICDISITLCQAGAYDSFLLGVAVWATLQLGWTLPISISMLYQISRQMTSLETINLGRYGYMGGRGGSSLRDQGGAMRQAMAVGSGGAGDDPATDNTSGLEGSLSHSHGTGCDHGHGGRQRSHGNFCSMALKKISAPCMHVLGLDRFTKGNAIGGMKKAGRGQNPFDLGMFRNCQEFWTGEEGVDYTRLYEIPPEGWATYRRKAKMSATSAKGYQPVSGAEEV